MNANGDNGSISGRDGGRSDWWKWILSVSLILFGSTGIMVAIDDPPTVRYGISIALFAFAFITPAAWWIVCKLRDRKLLALTANRGDFTSSQFGAAVKTPRRWPLVSVAVVAMFILAVMVDPETEDNGVYSADGGGKVGETRGVMGDDDRQENAGEPVSGWGVSPGSGIESRTGEPLAQERASYQRLPDFEGSNLCSVVDSELAEAVNISGPFRADAGHCVSDGESLSLRAALEQGIEPASECALEAEFSFLDILDHEPYSYRFRDVFGYAEIDTVTGTSIAGWSVQDHCFQLALHTFPTPPAYLGGPSGATEEELIALIDEVVFRSSALVVS